MAQENVARSCQVVEKPIVWGDTSLRRCRFCCDFCDICQGFALSRNSGPCLVRGSWIDNSGTHHGPKRRTSLSREPRELLAKLDVMNES